ncbi:hypothetical protein GCM10009527_094590 [Actinomadura nitritigenes]|uniref:RskA family anti-sigma factor n=1 Tax=Actinomadura nitritigenes TaxID=134602 RepID=UPI00336EDC8D
MTHDPHDLAAPYALDALTNTERRLFERHLSSCTTCTEQTTGIRETATRPGAPRHPQTAARPAPAGDGADRPSPAVSPAAQTSPRYRFHVPAHGGEPGHPARHDSSPLSHE